MRIRSTVCAALFSSAACAADISAFFTTDYSNVITGGIREDSTLRALAGLSIEHQLSDDWLFYAEGQLQRGNNGSDSVGDLQAFSNIDEDDFSRLYAAWLQWQIHENWQLTVGQQDANAEFAVADNAGEFINSSMGFSPTIGFLPTYPLPRLAITSAYQQDNHRFSAGLFADDDNRLDAPFYIAEYQLAGELIWKLGLWHKRNADSLQGEKNITGGYAVLQPAKTQSSYLGNWYVQLGASPNDAEITRHVGIGSSWASVPSRPDDSWGLGVSHVQTSKLASELRRSESNIELYYRAQLYPQLAVKPELQWIQHPAAAPEADDALVFTLRFELTL